LKFVTFVWHLRLVVIHFLCTAFVWKVAETFCKPNTLKSKSGQYFSV